MVLCGKRVKNKERKLKKNKVVPITSQKVTNEYLERFNREEIKCGGCNGTFDIGSNELKIHCNLCDQFFHCKIAGKCSGEKCKMIKKGGSIHQASYCYGCMGLITKNKMLCKDCFLDEHLETI
jgi:hypothetical protein